jgi:hypothetical protein
MISSKKTKGTGNIDVSIAPSIEKDHQINACELATTHDLPFGTIHTILTDDLGLFKESAYRDPKLLSTAQKRNKWTAATTSWNSVDGALWQI